MGLNCDFRSINGCSSQPGTGKAFSLCRGICNSSPLMQQPKCTAFPTTKPLSLAMSILAPKGSCCSFLWRWFPESAKRAGQHLVTLSLYIKRRVGCYVYFHFPPLFDSAQQGQETGHLLRRSIIPKHYSAHCKILGTLIQLVVALIFLTHTLCLCASSHSTLVFVELRRNCHSEMSYSQHWDIFIRKKKREREILGFRYFNGRF